MILSKQTIIWDYRDSERGTYDMVRAVAQWIRGGYCLEELHRDIVGLNSHIIKIGLDCARFS